MENDLTAAVAAGAGNTVIKPKGGRLRSALVTTTGTGTGDTLIYDSPNTNTGTVIGIVPSNATVTGTIIEFDMPAATGIFVVNQTNGPGMTINYR